MPWVIEARNNEILPEYEKDMDQNPIRYSWDQNWYVIDRKAVVTREAGFLINRAFSLWDAMEPSSIEECTEAMVDLATKCMKDLRIDGEPAYALIQWRLRNFVTGEIIPGEIFAV